MTSVNNPEGAPDYLTPFDVYATHIMQGLLAGNYNYSNDHTLAREVVRLTDLLLVERERFFARPAPHTNPAVLYQLARDSAQRVDYGHLSVDEIRKLHARHNAQGLPFKDRSEACAAVPMQQRYPGLQVQVGAPGCYSWWPTTDLSNVALVPVPEVEE